MSTVISDAGVQFSDGNTQAYPVVPVRQTVLSGAVDSNGFSSFGGSTGSTTVTASTTLIATAANGVSNRTGSIVNPSWTGLSTNGTMYLGLTVNADGTCTPYSSTLGFNYQWGGTYSVTSGQRTFNIQEMTTKVGNGSVAAQSYDVQVGEVIVAGGVVTAIVWYALMGRYDSGFTATLPSSITSKNSNLGVADQISQLILECTTADSSYSVGERLNGATDNPGASGNFSYVPIITTRNTVAFQKGATTYYACQKANNVAVALNNTSWKYKLVTARAW